MNAMFMQKFRRRMFVLASLGWVLAGGLGCASYFPTGEKSYDELKAENQQKAQEKKMMFKPGTVLYTQ